MSKAPMPPSERRGILVVAALALIVTALGLGVAYCNQNRPETTVPVEIIMNAPPDSVKPKPVKKNNPKRDASAKSGKKTNKLDKDNQTKISQPKDSVRPHYNDRVDSK